MLTSPKGRIEGASEQERGDLSLTAKSLQNRCWIAVEFHGLFSRHDGKPRTFFDVADNSDSRECASVRVRDVSDRAAWQ
jgi:hypothetical protein